MNIGVLASHEGTTLQSVLDACATGRIPGRVVVVVSNNGHAGALIRAREAGVPAVHLSSRTHPDAAELDEAIRAALVAAGAELVLLAGYMKRLGPAVVSTFNRRILNTHPALLPRFGGHGMYGDRVFQAVLESGDPESGVSIHVVDSEYDSGPVVCQCRVPVLPGDSIDTLKTRTRVRERDFVVDTLARIAEGNILLANEMTDHELITPADATEWRAYHDIRRRVLFEARGQSGVYREDHPDDRTPGNHPKILLYRGEPVGVVRIDVDGTTAMCRRVAIRSDVQRRGHGRVLLSLVQQFARDTGCERVVSYVAPDAVEFYERCGFIVDGDGTIGQSGAESVFMTKRLERAARQAAATDA